MPTKSFKELVQKHVADDWAIAEALLRDNIKATVGFEKLDHQL
jgi:hypothetical protein